MSIIGFGTSGVRTLVSAAPGAALAAPPPCPPVCAASGTGRRRRRRSRAAAGPAALPLPIPTHPPPHLRRCPQQAARLRPAPLPILLLGAGGGGSFISPSLAALPAGARCCERASPSQRGAQDGAGEFPGSAVSVWGVLQRCTQRKEVSPLVVVRRFCSSRRLLLSRRWWRTVRDWRQKNPADVLLQPGRTHPDILHVLHSHSQI